MSDRAHRRQPATLPEGYQYGDAQDRCDVCGERGHSWCGPVTTHVSDCALPFGRCTCGADPDGLITPMPTIPESWRAPHENAAAQLIRRASTFRLGVDTCPTCGTKGKYDCPDCGIPFYAKRNQQRTGDEAV